MQGHSLLSEPEAEARVEAVFHADVSVKDTACS